MRVNLCYNNTIMTFLNLTQAITPGMLIFTLLLAGACYWLDRYFRKKQVETHLFFAWLMGSVLSFLLIHITTTIFSGQHEVTPYTMALGAVVLLAGWRALFGPWQTKTKAAILATFLFWVTFHRLALETPDERSIHFIAMGTALVPAVLWCVLFLKYHHERLSSVLLMFFAGMLSTVPILAYDAFVRGGVEFQFFLFRITPENFSVTSHGFVSGQLGGVVTPNSAILASLVTFLIVGLIEEVSKAWVVMKSGKRLFESIDDVIELAIIAAIGFAFAENILNPSYFGGFVRDFLLSERLDIQAFLGSVVGRSVLTSMVHILSTGVFAYFLGVAMFADTFLEERIAMGKKPRVSQFFARLFRLPVLGVFRTKMVIVGLLVSLFLHGMFNFLVTLPDLLPGRPQSIGQLVPELPGFIGSLPLLLIPALFYVVGGFWLLTSLFLKTENMRLRGHLVMRPQEQMERV